MSDCIKTTLLGCINKSHNKRITCAMSRVNLPNTIRSGLVFVWCAHELYKLSVPHLALQQNTCSPHWQRSCVWFLYETWATEMWKPKWFYHFLCKETWTIVPRDMKGEERREVARLKVKPHAKVNPGLKCRQANHSQICFAYIIVCPPGQWPGLHIIQRMKPQCVSPEPKI